ncbi:MAG: DUF3078 domain-containing protein [Muribaculaceae bacterium]|nr:DUF3078 domain-containing protein [Muribaculaceae bacterium]
MRNIITSVIASLMLLASVNFDMSAQNHRYKFIDGKWVELTDEATDEAAGVKLVTDSIANDSILEIVILPADTTLNVDNRMFPAHYYLPMVFDGYEVGLTPDSIKSNAEPMSDDDPLAWVNNVVDTDKRFRRFKQQYMVSYPQSVPYNINTLPVAPKKFQAYVDPSTAKITVAEINIDQSEVKSDVKPVEVKKKYWLSQFNGHVQFSQAYVSPNWYQGGKNNLNILVSAVYNIKLNQTFNPNLLFDNTFSYKLGTNSESEDQFRKYSISEDIFQVNSKFGIKAAKLWYYSATMQFKTQFLNNYTFNTESLKAAFLSPGELNIGLGMTYAYTSKNGKFSANASIAPLSYNLRICTDEKLRAAFGIDLDRTTVSQYGSNIDAKLSWRIAHNISYNTRLTAFTNYSYIQSDWEHTLAFTINKYLTTQLYVHLRYDSQALPMPDSKWNKFQVKEILSFGFSYAIGTV